jgi:hypothetical protein
VPLKGDPVDDYLATWPPRRPLLAELAEVAAPVQM